MNGHFNYGGDLSQNLLNRLLHRTHWPGLGHVVKTNHWPGKWNFLGWFKQIHIHALVLGKYCIPWTQGTLNTPTKSGFYQRGESVGVPAEWAATRVCSLWGVVRNGTCRLPAKLTAKWIGPSRFLHNPECLLRKAKKPQTPVIVWSSDWLCSLGNPERTVLRKIPLILFAKKFHFLPSYLSLVSYLLPGSMWWFSQRDRALSLDFLATWLSRVALSI